MKKLLSMLMALCTLFTNSYVVFADTLTESSVYAEKEFVQIVFKRAVSNQNDYSVVVKNATAGTVVPSTSEWDGDGRILTANFTEELALDTAYSVIVSDGTNRDETFFMLNTILNDTFDYASDDALKANWTMNSGGNNDANITIENNALKYISPASSVNCQSTIYPKEYASQFRTLKNYVVEYKITHQGRDGYMPVSYTHLDCINY